MQEMATTSANARCQRRNAVRRSNIAYTARPQTTPTTSAATSAHDASRASGFWITSLRNPALAPMSPASA